MIDTGALEIVERDDGAEISVKVVPGASREAVAGVLGSALKIAVSAPPEGGKANTAVEKLLAAVLGVKKGDVIIIRGRSQPLKRVRIAGLTADGVRERLAQL